MPKIIKGKDRESRIGRLENNIKGKGGKKLGPPPWAKKDKSKGKPDHARN